MSRESGIHINGINIVRRMYPGVPLYTTKFSSVMREVYYDYSSGLISQEERRASVADLPRNPSTIYISRERFNGSLIYPTVPDLYAVDNEHRNFLLWEIEHTHRYERWSKRWLKVVDLNQIFKPLDWRFWVFTVSRNGDITEILHPDIEAMYVLDPESIQPILDQWNFDCLVHGKHRIVNSIISNGVIDRPTPNL